MECFLCFIRESQRVSWTRSDLEGIEKACKWLRTQRNFTVPVPEKYQGDRRQKDVERSRTSCYVIPPLLLFTRMAYVRGTSLQSPLDAVGIMDTIEQLVDLLIDLTQVTTTRAMRGQLVEHFNRAILSMLIIIEAAVATNKASTVASLLRLMGQVVSLISSRRSLTLSSQPFPSSSLAMNDTSSSEPIRCSLAGVLIQCASRLVYHCSGRRLFFHQLHPNSGDATAEMGKQLVDNRQLFKLSLTFLSALLLGVSESSSAKNTETRVTVFTTGSWAVRSYSSASISFLKSVLPGILSQMANLASLGDLFRLRGADDALEIVDRLVRPVLANQYCRPTRSGSELNTLLARCRSDSVLVKAFPPPGRSNVVAAGPLGPRDDAEAVFLSRTFEGLATVLQETLRFIVDRVDPATFTTLGRPDQAALQTLCEQKQPHQQPPKPVAVGSFTLQVLQRLAQFSLSLFDPLVGSFLDPDAILATEAEDSKEGTLLTKRRIELRKLVVEILGTTFYLLRFHTADHTVARLYKNMFQRLQTPECIPPLAEDVLRFKRTLDPLALSVALDSTAQARGVLVRLLGFLHLLLPSTHSPLEQASSGWCLPEVADVIGVVFPVFRVDWRLVRPSMLDTAACCLDALQLWIDEVPLDDTALFHFTRSSVRRRVPQDIQALEDAVVAACVPCTAVTLAKSTGTELAKRSDYDDDDDDQVLQSVISDILGRAILLTHRDLQYHTTALDAIGNLLTERVSLRCLIRALLEMYETRWDAGRETVASAPSERIESFFQPSYIASSVPYALSGSLISDRLSFLYILLFVLKASNATWTSEDADDPIVWQLVDLLTTPVALGGFWVDSSDTFRWALRHEESPSAASETIGKEGCSAGPLSTASLWNFSWLRDADRIAITNFVDTVLLATLATLLRGLNNLSVHNCSPNARPERDIGTDGWARLLLGRFKALSYSVLKKCGSPYQWPALTARCLLRRIVCFVQKHSHSQANKPAADEKDRLLGPLAPGLFDAISYELQAPQCIEAAGSAEPSWSFETSPWGYPVGNALLAALTFADDATILLLSDIVTTLTTDSPQPLAFPRATAQNCLLGRDTETTSINRDPQVAVFVCTFKARAGIAKRLSSMVTRITAAGQEPVAESSAGATENRPQYWDVSEEADQLLLKDVYGGSALPPSAGFPLCATSLRSSSQTEESCEVAALDLSAVNDSETSPVPAAITVMATALLRFSRRYLFHTNPHIQFLAHLTCLYSLHCHSVSRRSLLPHVHELWDALKASLTRPIAQSVTSTSHSTSVLLLAALALRCAVLSSETFLTTRFQGELFPVIASTLRALKPVQCTDVVAQCNLLRTQLALFDVLHTAAESKDFIRPLAGDCLGLCVPYWDVRAAEKLQGASLRLTARCVASDPERCLLLLVALANRLQTNAKSGSAALPCQEFMRRRLTDQETTDLLSSGLRVPESVFSQYRPTTTRTVPLATTVQRRGALPVECLTDSVSSLPVRTIDESKNASGSPLLPHLEMLLSTVFNGWLLDARHNVTDCSSPLWPRKRLLVPLSPEVFHSVFSK